MNLLNLLTGLKIKWWLIIGLIGIIIILIIIVSFSKKPTKPNQNPLPSSSPLISAYPQSSSLFNNLVSPSPSMSNNILNEPIDDPSIGNTLKEIYTQKPWLNKLPIVTKSYVIVYDWQKEIIRIALIINNNSGIPYNQQVEQIKSDSLKQLEKIGVDLNKEGYYYTFTP